MRAKSRVLVVTWTAFLRNLARRNDCFRRRAAASTGYRFGDYESASGGKITSVERVLVLGRGGAGKSTLASRLGSITGLPVVELDKLFWQPDLGGLPPEKWTGIQREIVAPQKWILDGDLGPADVLRPRLEAADTVLVLNYSMIRCSWRSARRSRERRDYWGWLLAYRRRSLPAVMDAIATCAANADVHVFRTPRTADRFLDQLTAR